MGSTLDKLLERIIEIKEKEPNLITESQFINILKNVFVGELDPNVYWVFKELEVFEIDGMKVFYYK